MTQTDEQIATLTEERGCREETARILEGAKDVRPIIIGITQAIITVFIKTLPAAFCIFMAIAWFPLEPFRSAICIIGAVAWLQRNED